MKRGSRERESFWFSLILDIREWSRSLPSMSDRAGIAQCLG